MAMREATRRWAMRGAWAALLVAGSLLIGLRIGRPVYYTDGSRQIDGRELANAGMLEWRTPQVVVEVPGPVAGRIAELVDGRLLYGRVGDDGTADLVTWNPSQPAIPPEPVHGLNSPQNDLAPAVAADGRILFASDRDGGAGGYDLYLAPRLLAAASDVAAIPACRTALDETDPALHPDGSELVFVRSDRRIDGGNDGTLWRWRWGDELDPVPAFVATTGRARRVQERDPVWSPDGAALWFVKKVAGERLQVVRASCHGSRFDEPLVVGARWPTGELRSPLPSRDGRALGLLLPRSSNSTVDLWYAAAGHEVYPWWPGQRWLEWILLGIVATSVLLLILLHLGRRWSTLDLVAQCLLLSLLLHLLLYLWLMGVEIAGSLLPGNDEAGGFEVNVVTASVASASAGSEVGASVQFTPDQRSLAAAAPDSQLQREERTTPHEAGSGAWERAVVEREVTADTRLTDAAAAIEKREGVDAAMPVAAVALPAVDSAAAERAAAPANQRAAAAAEAVEVRVPVGSVARAPASKSLLAAPAAAADLSAPAATPVAVTAPTLQDAGSAVAAAPGATKAGADAPAASPELAAQAAAVAIAAPAAPAARRAVTTGESGAAVAVPVAAPGSALARSNRSSLAAPAAAATPLAGSSSSRSTTPAVALRESLAPTSAPAAARPVSPSASPPSLQPVAAAAAAPAESTALPTPRAATTGIRVAEPVVPTPGSALRRANRSAPPSAAAVAANAAPSPRQLPQPGPASAMPTGLAATVAPVRRAESAAAQALAPLAATAPAPQASTLPRVARARDPGAFAARELVVTPPASSLLRPRTSEATVPAALPVAAGTAYSNRFGPAKVKALEQFGGTDVTERAVANGLRYLAKIQNRDGSWGNREDYDSKYGLVYIGKTALCVLAFLGAGHTPQSNSEHSAVVERALAHLLSVQDDNGAFGPSSCYGHGITTYALAECYGLSKRAELRQPLERALTWILDHQGPRRDRRNRGGWGYFSPGLGAEDDYARMSVSSWMIMALESARLSGIELPPQVLPAAREFVELAYDQPNGWFRYNHKPSRINSAWPTLPASTPAGAFCLLLLGADKADPKVQTAVAYTVERRPDAYRRYDDEEFVLRGQGNVYFWYYGTLAAFLAGGDAWAQWNERLRTVIPAAQAKDGSFPPIDVYAEEAGDSRRDRSYTTAMCVLCLEVYYRYFTPLLVGR